MSFIFSPSSQQLKEVWKTKLLSITTCKRCKMTQRRKKVSLLPVKTIETFQGNPKKFSATNSIMINVASVGEQEQVGSTSNLHKPSIVGSGRKSKRISQIIPTVLIKEILVPNQIVPRVAPLCFRYLNIYKLSRA